jgi:hypothetical protein
MMGHDVDCKHLLRSGTCASLRNLLRVFYSKNFQISEFLIRDTELTTIIMTAVKAKFWFIRSGSIAGR